MKETLFSGLKVVEFASVLAGPAVGMFFAELGAEVVKIENALTQGDITRRWKVSTEDPNAPISAYFCSVNWGKRHLLLNLSWPEHRVIALQYVESADVVIANFKPTSAQRLGLDAATLRAQNRRLIHAQVHGWPDPQDDRPAFDAVLQAEAGFLHMTGHPETLPAKMPVALIDLLAAHQLKEAILLALWRRERTGEGCEVSVSLFESAIASLANQATNWLMAGYVPERIGTQHPNIAPYGDVYTCADGQMLLLAVGTERQFEHLCRCMHLDHLLTDLAFSTNQARVQNRQALNATLQQVFSRKDRAQWLSTLRAEGVPAAQIRTLPEVFALPEAKALVLEGYTPEGLPVRCVRTAVFRMQP